MMTQHKPGLIAAFRQVAATGKPGVRPLAKNTVETYLHWVRLFARFTGRPALQWTGEDVERFLWHLHRERYAVKTRKQALCALVFVFKHVLNVDVGTLNLPAMPKEAPTNKILPSRVELGRIFAGMKGMTKLMAGLMYGGGLRVMECCTLRVKDIDLEALTIRVHQGKGDKDRITLLARHLVPALQRHLAWRAALHAQDVASGAGLVELPGRYGVKNPSAARDLRWQYLFPSALMRGQYRWHLTPAAVQKAMREAVQAAGLTKLITPHTLRHAFCTHAQQAGNDIGTVSELMGHKDLGTTQIYTHADAARGISPMDAGPVMPSQVASALEW